MNPTNVWDLSTFPSIMDFPSPFLEASCVWILLFVFILGSYDRAKEKELRAAYTSNLDESESGLDHDTSTQGLLLQFKFTLFDDFISWFIMLLFDLFQQLCYAPTLLLNRDWYFSLVPCMKRFESAWLASIVFVIQFLRETGSNSGYFCKFWIPAKHNAKFIEFKRANDLGCLSHKTIEKNLKTILSKFRLFLLDTFKIMQFNNFKYLSFSLLLLVFVF